MNPARRRLRTIAAVPVAAATLVAASAAALHAQGTEAPHRYRLPARTTLTTPPDSAAALPPALRALPLSLDGVSAACVGPRRVLYVPVVMREPDLPIDLEALTLDPMDWDERRVFTRELGRRSLYFVEPGTTMLYGVVLDPGDLRPESIGVGLVVVKRVDRETYDILLQSIGGAVLAAARAEVEASDPSIGMGRMIPIEDQAAVRELYGAQWDLDPNHHGYPMIECR